MLTAVGMKGAAVVLSWCLLVLVGSGAGAGGLGSRAPDGGAASRCLAVCMTPPMGLVVGMWEGGEGGGRLDQLMWGALLWGMG